jgi:uncharacterized protein (DUF305 family)
MSPARNTWIALITAGLIVAGSFGAFAQSEHEGHHPGGVTEPTSPAPSTKSQETTPPQMGGMNCMMGGKGMPMMKMMHEMHGRMMGGGMAMQPEGDTGPASQAMNGVIARMQKDLALSFSGDVDVDFAKRLLVQHQAAVDMAKVVLVFGKDAEVKKLADGIVKANEADIASLQDWLKKQAK